MSRPKLQTSPPTTEQIQAKEEVYSAVPRTVQSRYTHVHTKHGTCSIHVSYNWVSSTTQCWMEVGCVGVIPLKKEFWLFVACFLFLTSKEMANSVSPKFIVTLDGVPSQLGNLSDCEMELDDVRPHVKITNVPHHMKREPKGDYHGLQGGATSSEGVEWRVEWLFWNSLSPFYSSERKCLVFF